MSPTQIQLNYQSPTLLPKLDRQQMSHALLSQLKTRNAHNTQIIRKYLRKIIKKQILATQQLLNNSPNQLQAPVLDRQLADEIQLLPEICDKDEMELCQQLPQTDQTIKDRSLLTTVDSNHEPTQKLIPPFDTINLLTQQKKIQNSCLLSIKVQSESDSNFLNQLKSTYVKQLFQKTRQNRMNYKQEARIQMINSLLSNNKYLNINVKSLVFGGNSSQDATVKCKRISTEARPNLEGTKNNRAPSKVSHNFLPSICRQLGKLKRSEVCLQTRMRGEQQGIRREYGQKIWQLDSMQRMGISFRINTLQVKRQY